MQSFYRLACITVLITGIMACGLPDKDLEHQTPLVKNQPYEGAQQTMDYNLAYRYVFSKGSASEPDRIEFTGKLTPRQGLETLTLRLHLLDAAGKVLATQVLYAPGGGQGAGRSTIDLKIDVPPGAVTLAFSHYAKDKPIIF